MDFYLLLRKDGTYDLICTRCFLTVASTKDPSTIQSYQTLHRCKDSQIGSAKALPSKNPHHKVPSRDAGKLLPQLASIRPTVLLILGALLLYAFRTAIESWLLYSRNQGLAIVAIGDLLGCACIFFVLRRKRLAVAVYVVTAAIEILAYSLNLLSGQALCWVTDLAPTLVVFAMMR